MCGDRASSSLEDAVSERVVELFLDLVKIDSESSCEEHFLEYLEDRLTSEIRAECIRDHYGNLIANVPAMMCEARESVLLGMHADTVRPGRGIEPVLRDGVIYSRGPTILGADDKAGIAEVLEAVRTAERHPPLQIVVTREEELGLQGARHLDTGLLTAGVGFVVDMDEVDALVIGGPSKLVVDVEVIGRAAHAGMHIEDGISAVRAACHGVVLLHEGRLDPEMTVNVGVFEGGTIRNGVPGHAKIKLECRSFDHDRCIEQGEHIRKVFELAAEAARAEAETTTDIAYRAARLSADALPVRVARDAMVSVGLQPQSRVIWGGTDASFYNAHGIETVVIGTGARAEHSIDEHISIEDMHTAVRVIREVLHLSCESVAGEERDERRTK